MTGFRDFLITSLLLSLTACGSDQVADNAELPPLSLISETPGDWSLLEPMIGRTPAESGLLDTSPISVDLAAKLGPEAQPYRSAMMQAGPLTRHGSLLVARAPDAWLVLQPEDHAMRLGLATGSGWREWQTAGASVPLPPDLPRSPA